MKANKFLLRSAACVILVTATAASSQGPVPTSDKRPEIPKSIANSKPTHFKNGPLFARAKVAFDVMDGTIKSNSKLFFVADAKLELNTYSYPDPTLHQVITRDFVKALKSSCDGPLSYDEGTTWVELNWVCRVDAQSLLARYYTFKRSPEIVMLIDFHGDQIKQIDAMEPLSLPGVKVLTMDAYNVAHSKR